MTMRDNRGSSTIAFVLILPWLVLAILSIVVLVVWILVGNTLHYQAYQGARKAGLYQIDVGRSRFFSVQKVIDRWRPSLTLKTAAPILFTLARESKDLSHQNELDRWGYPSMDNWILYCGEAGEYYLCR